MECHKTFQSIPVDLTSAILIKYTRAEKQKHITNTGFQCWNTDPSNIRGRVSFLVVPTSIQFTPNNSRSTGQLISTTGVLVFSSTPQLDWWSICEWISCMIHFFLLLILGSSSSQWQRCAPLDDPSDCEAMRHSSSEPDLRSDLKSTLQFNTLLVFCHLYVCHSCGRSAFFVNSWSMRKITRSWQSGPGSMPRRLSTEKFPACSSRHVKSHYCDFLSFAPLLQRAHTWRRTYVKRHGRMFTHTDTSRGRHATHLCRWRGSVSSLT